MFVIFGPMVLAFVACAAMKPNLGYVAMLALALALTGAMAAAPVPPSNGPDDWYNGIGRAGGLLGLAGAATTIVPQALRRFVPLGIFAYLAALAGAVFIAFNLTIFLGGI